jgi:glycosyltransferase involved in cell wall biosynthesis
MNDAPLISVIIPTFNGAEFLEAACASVLWQSHTHWECIIVDDGSTDETPAVCKRLVEKDKRFKYVRQGNSGVGAARNTGIAKARGTFLQFLDDDDIIPADRFAACLSFLQNHPGIDVAYSDYVSHQAGKGFVRGLPAKMPAGDPFLALLLDLNVTFAILTHSWLFRRRVFEDIRFDVALGNQAEDQECWVRIAGKGFSFGYIDEVLAIYRYTPHSLASDEAVLLQRKIDVLEKYADHPGVLGAPDRYRRAVTYLRERLAIGFFMKKSFSEGMRVFQGVWPHSSWSGRCKVIAWFLLMIPFTKDQVAGMREWILRTTGVRWGGWKEFRVWDAPEPIRRLMTPEAAR